MEVLFNAGICLIVSAAMIFSSFIIGCSISDLAAATVGVYATSSISMLGWYAIIISSVLFVVGVILLIFARKNKK